MVLSFGVADAADRMVIGEMFTNTGCPPCYNADLALDRISDEYYGVFALIRYHVWWPDPSDPYYNFNINENATRTNYYNPGYVPRFYAVGNHDGGSNYGGWENIVDNESLNPSPLIMDIWGSYDGDARTGTISVRIIAEQDPALAQLRLRIALIEDDIRWHAPNGVPVHHQTFRDMIPNTTGQGITLEVGDTLEYSYNFTLNNSFAEENCKFVAFVQSNVNKHILQGARVTIPDLNALAADDEVIPNAFALRQNFPNPFNAETRIDFETAGGLVNLEIYDLNGALVTALVQENMAAGRHSIIWDGTNSHGKPVTSGVYFYRLQDTNGSDMRKMTLLK
jgi:hypothetical protein